MIIYEQFKLKHGSIFIGYYKSHGVDNGKIIWVALIKIYWLIVIKIKLFLYFYKQLIDLQYYA